MQETHIEERNDRSLCRGEAAAARTGGTEPGVHQSHRAPPSPPAPPHTAFSTSTAARSDTPESERSFADARTLATGDPLATAWHHGIGWSASAGTHGARA
ncbi:hypothetical protein Ade02nite_77350 [Paractinoplanes deccanensis]|uniref:Uncharacterized protein n=1 Tax=Paractinoplanes deccanensis TaxID=113561 RepID=A0ABQ3YGF9_9ACTN|nr:hypothetical protein Ade02nite_77350 [Actinoplanes deccanensis]